MPNGHIGRALDGTLTADDCTTIIRWLYGRDWFNAEYAAEVAEAAAAHAARAPLPNVERGRRLALVSSLVPALVHTLSKKHAIHPVLYAKPQEYSVATAEKSLAAIATLLGAGAEPDALHRLQAVCFELYRFAHPPSLLRPLAALLKQLAVYPKLRLEVGVLMQYRLPSLLQSCLRDEHASAILISMARATGTRYCNIGFLI